MWSATSCQPSSSIMSCAIGNSVGLSPVGVGGRVDLRADEEGVACGAENQYGRPYPFGMRPDQRDEVEKRPEGLILQAVEVRRRAGRRGCVTEEHLPGQPGVATMGRSDRVMGP